MQSNHKTWLEVNNSSEKMIKEEGLAQSNGGGEENGTAMEAKFNESNACTFSCVSDAVTWCGSRGHTPSMNDLPAAVEVAERVQVLVTGSLYLVGMAMGVLGFKVDTTTE